MATQPPLLINSPINPYDYLHIVDNLDGTLTRSDFMPVTLATTGDNCDDSSVLVLTKDTPLNAANKTWLRIFRPRHAHDKLPLIIYYHGGGFILGSAAWTLFHDFCTSMAIELQALIVSVAYRLAPESRLPAAYDDAVEAVNWVRNQALLGVNTGEKWLCELADFSQCFLMGSSAGGNIAYHVGLRVVAAMNDIEPVKITGLILHQPFFGGSERTATELRSVNDQRFPLFASDLMWELGLPNGADRDHEYCNPMVDSELANRAVQIDFPLLEKGCLVSGYKGDPLVDRQMEFAKMLKRQGVRVVARFEEGGFHGVDLFDSEKCRALIMLIKGFIFSSLSS